jgi:hypothetical protein
MAVVSSQASSAAGDPPRGFVVGGEFSGAQRISTDYFTGPDRVSFPGDRTVRGNPAGAESGEDPEP